MTAVRIGASFLLAAVLCISAPVVALYVVSNGDLSQSGLLLAVLIMGVMPTIVLGGLLWLPALLWARLRSAELRFAAILLSVLPGSVWVGANALRRALRDPIEWRWESLILPAIFMITFSAIFLWIDRRWGERPGPAAAAVLASLAIAAPLGLFLLWQTTTHGASTQ